MSMRSEGTGKPILKVFPAIRMLRGLKTLYMQSSETTVVDGPADLTCCMHLQCVAVQGIKFCGVLSLPPCCLLHAKLQLQEYLNNISHRINGPWLGPGADLASLSTLAQREDKRSSGVAF